MKKLDSKQKNNFDSVNFEENTNNLSKIDENNNLDEDDSFLTYLFKSLMKVFKKNFIIIFPLFILYCLGQNIYGAELFTGYSKRTQWLWLYLTILTVIFIEIFEYRVKKEKNSDEVIITSFERILDFFCLISGLLFSIGVFNRNLTSSDNKQEIILLTILYFAFSILISFYLLKIKKGKFSKLFSIIILLIVIIALILGVINF